MDKNPHAILSDFPKSWLTILANAQRKLLRQRKGRGVSEDMRSVKNLKRLELALEAAR